MKKLLSLSLIAVSFLFISCNQEAEPEELTATGEVTEEIEVKTEIETEIETKSEVKTENASESTTSTTPTKALEQTTQVPSTKSFSITAKKWSFSPSTITVNEGDTVKLSINSTDVNHGFFLSAFNVSETLTAGATTNISFVASKAGTYSFTCSVFCGSGHSDMVGTLIVK